MRYLDSAARIALSACAALLTLTVMAAAQSPLFEVEDASATRLMRVADDGAVSIGPRATSSGASVAMGLDTEASATGATALGNATKATGNGALSAGTATTASGINSAAIGETTTASGHASFAAGVQSTASGEASVALGTHAVASGNGSFAFGDASSTGTVAAVAANQFVVRAAGGFRFLTNPNLITGCDLNDGNLLCTGTVSGSSSVTLKHEFEPVDAEAVLEKLAGLHIQRWRYLADTADVRHVGPTAEDFHGAFGLGASDRAIAMVDADGINMLAVQALARRTDELRRENTGLRTEVTELRRELDTLLSLIGSGR